MRHNDKLRHERQNSEAHWRAFVQNPKGQTSEDWLAQSWQISQQSVPFERNCAPMGKPELVRSQFIESQLYQVAQPILDELKNTLVDTGFAIGLSNAQAQLQWTASSRAMVRKLEAAHFMPSAYWDEASIGTNAVGLAARTGKAVSVFSAQHYVPSLHEWVCYAAPVVHATTGQLVAVLDVSAPWQHSTSMALATVNYYAQRLSQLWSQMDMHTETVVYLCSRVEPVTQSAVVVGALPRRLKEIFLVLALHPEGLSLERLHALVYGDESVSMSTLKSEMSHLRAQIGSVLQARPYRLELPTSVVPTDAQRIEQLVQHGRLREAMMLYQKPLLLNSSSPAVCEYRDYLHCLVIDALERSQDIEALWQFATVHESEFAVLNRLQRLLPANDVRQSTIRAKLTQLA